MGLKLVDGAKLDFLSALAAYWTGRLSAGLFAHDWVPADMDTITAVVPATFSGYAGLLPITGWGAPTLSSSRAVAQADALTWTHNGGPVGNWIFGLYVVDSLGGLVWAERRPDGPRALNLGGTTYSATPGFSLGSC